MARAVGTKKVATSSSGSSSCCANDRAEMEKIAYKLFLERGGVHGYHQGDWLKAEAIVKGKKKS
jgi:hypothetical protein